MQSMYKNNKDALTMTADVIAGFYTSRGNKAVNQDSVKCTIPALTESRSKGAVAAVADGISSSQVSQHASDLAVMLFCDEYLRTSDVWSAARAGTKVLEVINLQLLAKTQHSQYQDNFDQGFVCTFAGVILANKKANLFNCGDSSIFRIRNSKICHFSQQHRAADEYGQQYLSNALGIRSNLQLDVQQIDLVIGDCFILATDGITEFVSTEQLLGLFANCESEQQLQHACQKAAELALANASDDNLSIVAIKQRAADPRETVEYTSDGFLPLPDALSVGDVVDNFKLINQLHKSDRSSLFEVHNTITGATAVMKVPSLSLQTELYYLDELAKEEWLIAKVDHPRVVKRGHSETTRHVFYTLTERVQGITLRQWLNDNGNANLQQVRAWLTQLVSALGALHSKGILHQDIRPENIMIDQYDNLVLLDLGSASLHGQQFSKSDDVLHIPGDMLYSAPEYFLGYWPELSSDMFALAVMTYHALSGTYPYDTSVAKVSNLKELQRLQYKSLLHNNLQIPVWVDAAINKACKPDMQKRYLSLSEFLFDMHNPNPAYNRKLPLLERNPVLFWQLVSAVLALLLIINWVSSSE